MKYLRLSAVAVSLALLTSCAKPPRVPEEAATAASVRVDGVGLLDVGNNEQQIVDPDKLSEALAKLPVSAWPYGRVVAIQEISASSSEEDKAKLRKNRALAAGALESMQVLINWVPSA